MDGSTKCCGKPLFRLLLIWVSFNHDRVLSQSLTKTFCNPNHDISLILTKFFFPKPNYRDGRSGNGHINDFCNS